MAGNTNSGGDFNHLESILENANGIAEQAEAITAILPYLKLGSNRTRARAAKALSEAASRGADLSIAIPALADSLGPSGNNRSHVHYDTTNSITNLRSDSYAALLKAAGDDRTKDAVALHVTAHLARCTIHSWANAKELLVVSATNGAEIDLAALRQAMRSFMENGRNGWIRRFSKIDLDRMVPHAYMQIAEAIRVRKSMYSERPGICGDGLGLEARLKPPKSGRDGSGIYRVQANPNQAADRTNAPRLVKGVG